MSNKNNEFRDKVIKAYNAEVEEALKKVDIVGLDSCSDILQPIREKYLKMANNNNSRILTSQNETHNVFIISGAPASGKTTYVQNKRKQGDLVFDLDAICAALGGTSELYEDHKPYLDTAFRVRDVIYEQIENRTGKWHDAYVITASNDSNFVEALAERLNGTVIAMKATREQCIEQAKKDERRKANLDKQIEIINEWFDTRS